MIRILMMDGQELVRAGISHVLEEVADFEVVGQTGSGREGVRLCEQLHPDVVLSEYVLPDMDGLEAVEQISALGNGTRSLVLTVHDNVEYATRTMQAGASGFIAKSSTADDLQTAIRKVASQSTYVSPALMEQMISRLGQTLGDAPEAALSNREMQVLLRLARGARTREVAEALCLSLSTVETYRSRVLEKLDLRNNSDITRFAIRRGLIGCY